MWYMKSKYMVFYYKYLYLLLFFQNCVFKNLHLFPKSSFGQSQIKSSWFQKQQEFKIQNYNVPWAVLILNAMFIQIM
jgi:hypothetical protein